MHHLRLGACPPWPEHQARRAADRSTLVAVKEYPDLRTIFLASLVDKSLRGATAANAIVLSIINGRRASSSTPAPPLLLRRLPPRSQFPGELTNIWMSSLLCSAPSSRRSLSSVPAGARRRVSSGDGLLLAPPLLVPCNRARLRHQVAYHGSPPLPIPFSTNAISVRVTVGVQQTPQRHSLQFRQVNCTCQTI
jgi:hypothetical protein